MVSELIVTACGCTLSRSLSHVWLFATPWTMAHQAPLSIGFSRQEYWNGLPFPSPEDLPDPGVKAGSPALQAYSVWATRDAQSLLEVCSKVWYGSDSCPGVPLLWGLVRLQKVLVHFRDQSESGNLEASAHSTAFTLDTP